MKIKSIAAALSAAIMLAVNCTSMICSAAPEESTSAVTSGEVSATSTTTSTQNIPDTTVDWQQLHDDYYGDPYYDTDGNASLIDSKAYKVIFSSTELLFTAVTTKDGHVFYIIIDYADEDGEDNVYFLNKVDDFDLYSLLQNGNSNSGSSSSSGENKNTVEEYISKNPTTTNSSEDDETTSTAAASSGNGSGKLKLILLLILVVGIGAAGFILPKFLNKPKKTNIEYEDDELDEVSEDNE